jgi:hypothetical protein
LYTRENKGKLYRHKVVIQDHEYVGKETNFLLDPDMPEDDDIQTSDAATIPFFRQGINPRIKELLADPAREFHVQAGMTKADFSRMLDGVRDHRERALMGFIRDATTYDEKTGQLTIDPTKVRRQPASEVAAERLADLLRAAYEKVVGYHGDFDEEDDTVLAISLRYEDFTDMLIPRADSEAPMTLPHRHFLSIGMIDIMIRNGFVRWYAPDRAMLRRPVNIAYMTDVAKAVLGSNERQRRLEAAHQHRDKVRAVAGLEPEYARRNAKVAAKREQNAKTLAQILRHLATPQEKVFTTGPDLWVAFWTRIAPLLLIALATDSNEVAPSLKRMVSSTTNNPTVANVERLMKDWIVGERRKKNSASAAKRMRAKRARKLQAQQADHEADALINF